MGAPNLENEITGKVTQAVIRFLRSTKLTGHLGDSPVRDWETMLQREIAEVVAEYFSGDMLLIEDTPVKGESIVAYRARIEGTDPYPGIGTLSEADKAHAELLKKVQRWDKEREE